MDRLTQALMSRNADPRAVQQMLVGRQFMQPRQMTSTSPLEAIGHVGSNLVGALMTRNGMEAQQAADAEGSSRLANALAMIQNGDQGAALAALAKVPGMGEQALTLAIAGQESRRKSAAELQGQRREVFNHWLNNRYQKVGDSLVEIPMPKGLEDIATEYGMPGFGGDKGR